MSKCARVWLAGKYLVGKRFERSARGRQSGWEGVYSGLGVVFRVVMGLERGVVGGALLTYPTTRDADVLVGM